MMELLAHLSHLLHLLRHHAECERSPSSLRQATITTIVCINDDAEAADGSVTLQEALDILALMKVILKQCSSSYTFQELMHAFTIFTDAEGPSGCITYQALKQALVRNGGGQVLDSDIEQLLAEVAASPRDTIDYHDIVSSFFFDSPPKQ